MPFIGKVDVFATVTPLTDRRIPRTWHDPGALLLSSGREIGVKVASRTHS